MKIALYGPTPTLVTAAMMHSNVLKGLKPLTNNEVVFEYKVKFSSVSSIVTLII